MGRRDEGEKCLNGHPANSNGNCFNPTCGYRNDLRHAAVRSADERQQDQQRQSN